MPIFKIPSIEQLDELLIIEKTKLRLLENFCLSMVLAEPKLSGWHRSFAAWVDKDSTVLAFKTLGADSKYASYTLSSSDCFRSEPARLVVQFGAGLEPIVINFSDAASVDEAVREHLQEKADACQREFQQLSAIGRMALVDYRSKFMQLAWSIDGFRDKLPSVLLPAFFQQAPDDQPADPTTTSALPSEAA